MLRSTARSDARGQIWSLQYLRAAAAIAVVLFHQLQDVAPVFLAGEHGVDVFFVISGFIMIALAERREITPGRFMLDRIARIAPLYWTATLATFVLVSLGVNIWGASDDPGLLARSLFFVPSWNPDGKAWPTLFLGWTLNYEMFFYAAFALSLFLSEARRLPALAAGFCALVLAGWALPLEDPLALTYTSPLLLEFLAGAYVGKVMGVGLGAHPMGRTLLLLAPVVLGMGVLSLLVPKLAYGFAALLIVAAGLLVERAGALPRSRALKLLGDASFSIYLFQEFAFEAVAAVLSRFGPLAGLDLMSGPVAKPLSIAAAILGGVVAYRLVETPLTAAARRLLSRAAHAPARLGAAPAE